MTEGYGMKGPLLPGDLLWLDVALSMLARLSQRSPYRSLKQSAGVEKQEEEISSMWQPWKE